MSRQRSNALVYRDVFSYDWRQRIHVKRKIITSKAYDGESKTGKKKEIPEKSNKERHIASTRNNLRQCSVNFNRKLIFFVKFH